MKGSQGRPRKRRFFDSRIFLGIILIAAAIGGTVLVVKAFTQGNYYYVAPKNLLPGEHYNPADWDRTTLSGDDLGDRYVRVGDFPDNAVLARGVPAGELIPYSAIAKSDPDLRRVTVSLSGRLPADIVSGSVVEVWKVNDTGTGAIGGSGSAEDHPVLLASGAIVREITDSKASMTSKAATQVELLVRAANLNQVLAAIGHDARVVLVPEVS